MHAPRFTTSSRLAVAALGAGVALTLSACGSNDAATGSNPASTPGSTTSSASASGSGISAVHNDTDVTFIDDMTPHHSSAIEMAQMAADRAGSAQVKELASQIAAAQGPEQEKMKAMAAAWGVPTPSTDAAMAGGHDMSSTGSSAMPSASPSGMAMGTTMDMSMLESLSGTAFDKQFLTMMTEHHQSALPMAQAEISGGRNPLAQQLAQDIVTAQTAQISQMQEMLKTI